ncbi:MAG: STAS domain-containing protein [Candidatus Eremiobacteraeota bacterium]|nr:STAS domain-containing protein [Candidatus Eremiobacteraeota bacterium]
MANKPKSVNRVILTGEWDLARKDELIAALALLTMDGPAVIDLRGVTYADSTVLGVLGALRLKFRAVPITLLGAQTQLLKVLKIAGFDKLFHIVDDD